MRYKFLPLLILILLASSVQMFAGITGKLVGKVIDKETGEPLVGANVVIIGTSFGAAVDVSGDFFILNIPSGTYSVRASAIGYQPVIVQNVSISADITTSQNFSLSSSTVQVQEVVVQADRPLVERTTTATIRRTSAEDVITIPRESVQGLVALSAGVVDGQNFRGGRSTENLYQVDGLPVSNPQNGGFGGEGARTNYFSTVSPLAVEEVQVITGGFSAEYGNALSGIVNTVTKEGDLRNYEGTIRSKFDFQPLYGESDKGVQLGAKNESLYEFAFGGPMYLGMSSRFFLAGKFNYQQYRNNDYKWIDPDGNNTGQRPHNNFLERNINAKFTFNPTSNVKVTLSGFNGISMWENSTWSWLYGDYTQQASQVQSNRQLFARITHTLDNATFYEITAATFEQNFDAGKKAEKEYNKLLDTYEIFGFDNADRNNDGIIDVYAGYGKDGYEVNPATGHREGSTFAQGNRNPYGVVGASARVIQFNMFGNTRTYRTETSQYNSLNGSITSQVNKYNLVKAGFDLKLHNVKTQYNSLPWDANPFDDHYNYNPIEAAVYLQDKVEYKGLILNPGVRMDYLDPEAKKIANLLKPGNPPVLVDSKAKLQISPRFGIAFAVTDRSKFYLNYGWYFQSPPLTRLYDSITDLDLSRGNQIFGNPDLEPQRTKAFEAGYGNQLSDVFALDITAYYKDLYNIEGITFVPAVPSSYSVYSTGEYGNVRGVEFTLTKRLENYWRAKATYTYSVAKGTSSDVFTNYQLVTNGPPDPYTGKARVYPLTDYYLDFDRRHVLNLILDFVVPQGEGPVVGGVHVLQGMNVNFTTFYQTGTPYTRQDKRGLQVGEYNGSRHPDRTRTDMRISRDIRLASLFGSAMGKMTLTIFADVVNLLNNVKPIAYYAKSGVADNDGEDVSTPSAQPWTAASKDAAGFDLYHPNIDLNKDGINSVDEKLYGINKLRQEYFDSRNNGLYQQARQVWFGMTLQF
ncbi:MAG: TonB-dependent receptor [Bacteroidota bacterium]